MKLWFDNMCCVEAHGRAGGLALLWGEEVQLKILCSKDHCIDVEVSLEGESSWRLSCIYGWFESGQKYNTWDMINLLGRGSTA